MCCKHLKFIHSRSYMHSAHCIQHTYNIVYIKKELKTKENVKNQYLPLSLSLSLISHFSLFLFLSLSLTQCLLRIRLLLLSFSISRLLTRTVGKSLSLYSLCLCLSLTILPSHSFKTHDHFKTHYQK